jgi:hypothetical protein
LLEINGIFDNLVPKNPHVIKILVFHLGVKGRYRSLVSVAMAFICTLKFPALVLKLLVAAKTPGTVGVKV